MSNKYFVEVPINRPEDLPKEEGNYMVRLVEGIALITVSEVGFFVGDKKCIDFWMTKVAAYYPQVETGVLYKKMNGYFDEITDVDIIYDKGLKKDGDLTWLRPIQ